MCLLAGSLWVVPAVADEDYEPMARALVTEILYGDLHRPFVIEAIRAQNERDIDTDDAAIVEFEQQWYRESLDGYGPLISQVDQNSVSTYLRTLKAQSDALYTELLVMDKRGFLVAQSDIATDYFQGDERKFLLTFPRGAGEIFVDLVAYDASVQAIQSQVSFTIVDPDTGEPIGAATVGVNGDKL